MKTVYLIRHAKSSWKNTEFLDDIDRPLNKRGKQDAPRMAAVLRNKEISPDLLISSPALRAYTTALRIAEGIDHHKVQLDQRLYEASTTDIFSVIREVDNGHQSVLLFGHNPSYTLFANYYARPTLENVPTCGLVAVGYAVEDWKLCDETNGKFLFFDYPKRYYTDY